MPPCLLRALDFEDVYDVWFDFVWRSARRLGVDSLALDDVVQEVFLVVHRKLGDFEGRSSVKTWLFAITVRVASQHRRSVKRQHLHVALDETLVDTLGLSPADEAERHEANRVLHEILDTLSDDKRQVLVLAEFEEMSAPEIADALGVNVNTVYARLRSARVEFDKAMARHLARTRWRYPCVD